MINVVDHIEQALIRGKSKHSLTEVLDWYDDGLLRVAVGYEMSGSVRLHEGKAQIVHLAGKWNKSDVNWIMARMHDAMRDFGVTEITLEGRSGWTRFLKMKGVI